MGQKVMAILSWINPSQNTWKIVNNIALKILTYHQFGLNKFRPKRQKVLQIQVFGLKKSRPKVFHSPCDYFHAVMGQKVMVILSWINPRQNMRTKVNNIVLKIQRNRWLGLACINPGQNGRRCFNSKYLACKYSGQKLSIHHAITCSYGSKSYGNLVLNKSKPKYTNKSKLYPAKNSNKSPVWLE
jgi:hypothetical protein